MQLYTYAIGTKALEDDNTTNTSSSTVEVTTVAVDEDRTSNEDTISHTGGNDMDEDFKAWDEGDEQYSDEDKEESIKSFPLNTSSLNTPTVSDEWSKTEWPSIEPHSSSWERTSDDVPSTTSAKLTGGSRNGASAFNGNPSNSLPKRTGSLPSSKTSLSVTESDSNLKGRLNQSDIARLEEQAKWASMEIDYFADMQPTIASNKPPSVSSSFTKQPNKSTSSESAPAATNKLNYVPDEEVNNFA